MNHHCSMIPAAADLRRSSIQAPRLTQALRRPAGLLALAVLLSAASPLAAQSTLGYAEYYIPGEEADLIASIIATPGAGAPASQTAANINSVLSIVSSADNVQIFIDEWEDGYEFNPASPLTTADAKWDVATTGSGEQGAALTRGQVLTLSETNTYVTGSQGIDAGDRIYVTGAPVSVVRTCWADDPGTFVSGSWPLFPVQYWQSTFTVPIGTDIPAAAGNTNKPFTLTDLFVQARYDNTRVIVYGPTGTQLSSTVLAAGKSIKQTGVLKGTTVVATLNGSSTPRPVQAHLYTSTSGIDSRYYSLSPDSFVGSEYIVGVPSMTHPTNEEGGRNVNTAAYIFAKSNSTTVEISTASGTTTQVLNANDVFRFQMPRATAGQRAGRLGARFRSTDTTKKIQVLVASDDQRDNVDWGHQALPVDFLLNDYYVPFAPNNPLHVTPLNDNTTVYVDFNTDGVADRTYLMNRFDTRQVYDPDTVATGAHVYGNGPFQLAWGQDDTEFTPNEPNPDYDQGYTVLPLYWYDPVLGITHTATPIAMSSSGGTATFTTTVKTSSYDTFNVDIYATMPTGWTYVSGSSTVTYDDGTPNSTANPSVSGLNLTWALDHDLLANKTITITYQASTTGSNAGLNTSTASAFGTSIVNESDPTNAIFRPSATADILVAGPATTTVSVTKTSNASTRTHQTDPITYTITAQNTGATNAATNVTLWDQLPNSLTYVSGTSTITRPINGNYVTVADYFDSASYSLNRGTQTWRANTTASSWTESGESTDASGGDIIITSDQGSSRLRIKDNDLSITRSVNLTGAVDPTLRFIYRREALDNANDNVVVQASSNGTSWTQLGSAIAGAASGTTTDAAYLPFSASLAAFAGNNNVRIRFLTSSSLGNDDIVYVDNVEIEYTTRTTTTLVGSSPSILAQGFTLYPGETVTATFQAIPVQPAPSGVTTLTNSATLYSANTVPTTATRNDALGAIGDFVFVDINGNGTYQAGTDTLPSGVQINLIGLGADNTFGTSDDINYGTQSTNASGNYSFTGLAPGQYRVSPVTASLPAGTSVTSTNPVTITLTAGQTNNSGDFTLLMRGSVTGTVYTDTNGNGSKDDGETGIGGVLVTVTNGLGGSFTDTTEADGTWSVSGVPAGEASVNVNDADLPAGAVQTGGNDPTTVTVVGGSSVDTADGYQLRGSVTGTVYTDTNGNGSKDDGETGIGGVLVTVTNG
ncbi:hypothetical protein GC173_12250, partial [bacterium]|nr:hypothetical protein [bacterium]